jgi:two-component system CheB/CheR fusion protein
MPAKTGMTFIIVQHLSPDYKSMMAELIGKVTSMPVHVIEDGMEPKPDHIYLIPPNQNLTFFPWPSVAGSTKP